MNAQQGTGEEGQPRKRAKGQDRWAHRRGEPRLFAFLWTLFLLGATLLGFGSLRSIGMIDATTYRAVAQAILISVAVGVVVVWPMVRLSQVTPLRSGTRVAFIDFIVIAAPLQAVVLPQIFLPFGWPMMIVAALSGILIAWTIAIAGVLALAFGRGGSSSVRTPPERGWLWMLFIVFAAFAVPAVLLVSPQALTGVDSTTNGIRRLWLGSPVTGVYELTRRRPHTAIAPTLDRTDWLVITSPALIGSVLWLLAAGMHLRESRSATPPGGV